MSSRTGLKNGQHGPRVFPSDLPRRPGADRDILCHRWHYDYPAIARPVFPSADCGAAARGCQFHPIRDTPAKAWLKPASWRSALADKQFRDRRSPIWNIHLQSALSISLAVIENLRWVLAIGECRLLRFGGWQGYDPIFLFLNTVRFHLAVEIASLQAQQPCRLRDIPVVLVQF